MSYKVLIVDDDELVITTLKRYFYTQEDRYEVISASNGRIGYELAVCDMPDIILLDVKMPVMDGIDALRHLKENDTTRGIPVIMITGTNHLSQAFEIGAMDFIRKPIEKTELLVRVKSTLAMFKLLKGVESQSVQLEKQKREIEEEKKRTENLLLNILPFEVAEQLKHKGKVQAKHYRRVSVLFTDFKGFTKISEVLSSDEIVERLSFYFEKFDEIVEKHYIEKIKTIGDAYMCAGGLPIRNRSNPIDIVLAALEMQKFMDDNCQIALESKKLPWHIRIGVHTGEVVAGVIGKKKFAYDIWGDTVNTASRMESSGEAGKINISGGTYEYIKGFFECQYRGKVQAKNKGEIDMYFVNRIKQGYSSDKEGRLPNDEFYKVLSAY